MFARAKWFVVVWLVGGVLLSFTNNVAVAGGRNQSDNTKQCNGNFKFVGPYTGVIPGSTSFIMNNTPLDPGARRVMIAIDTSGDADPTSGGRFPSAIGQSHPTGAVMRVAKDKYQGQLVRYRYDVTGAIVSTEIETVEIIRADCNTATVVFAGLAFYFGFVNPGDNDLREPDISVDVSGFPPFTITKM